MSAHDRQRGHTCPGCGRTGIPCTIEDGRCLNDGDCERCQQVATHPPWRDDDDEADPENFTYA
jgi:hypothetical protein